MRCSRPAVSAILDPLGDVLNAARMKCRQLVRMCLFAAIVPATTVVAQSEPKFESLGNDTYTVEVHAKSKFTRDTEKLKTVALAAATEFSGKQGKVAKVVSVEEHKSFYLIGDFANVTLTFKTLSPGDPELAGQAHRDAKVILPATPTDSLYDELIKLNDLRGKGILTEEEFAAEKKKVLDRSK